MSNIDKAQGAVKASEVSTDAAQALLATVANDDLMTVVTQLRKVLTDSLQKGGGAFILTSRNAVSSNPGAISWTGTQLSFVINTDLILKLIQNESGNVVDLKAAYGATNTATTFNTISLASGEVLYIELDRSLVPGSGTLVLENAVGGGSLVSGKTLKKATSLPALATALSGPSGTLSIPLAINVDGHLWWIPHGIYWPPNVSSPLGSVFTSTTVPVGAVIALYTWGDQQVYGYTATKAMAPGFQLCDGSIIIDPQSLKANATRNTDGTPNAGTNFALDKFTPNLNGEHVTWTNTVAWTEGDYVINAGTRYVAIQNVPVSTAITNTAYWQTEATYNTLTTVNQYNKYRKTTQNQGKNTYVRGNNQSLHASQSGAYGGENTHALTTGELPGHTHPITTDPGHTHTGTTATGGSHNHGGNTGSGLPYIIAPWSAYGFETGDDGSAVGTFQLNITHTHSIPTDPGHTHSFTTATGGSHNHGGATGSTGSGTAHNNEPNYQNMVYLVRIY